MPVSPVLFFFLLLCVKICQMRVRPAPSAHLSFQFGKSERASYFLFNSAVSAVRASAAISRRLFGDVINILLMHASFILLLFLLHLTPSICKRAGLLCISPHGTTNTSCFKQGVAVSKRGDGEREVLLLGLLSSRLLLTISFFLLLLPFCIRSELPSPSFPPSPPPLYPRNPPAVKCRLVIRGT